MPFPIINYLRAIRKSFSEAPDQYLGVLIGMEQPYPEREILIYFLGNRDKFAKAGGKDIRFISAADIFEIDGETPSNPKQTLSTAESIEAILSRSSEISIEICDYYHISNIKLPAFLIYRNPELKPEILSFWNIAEVNKFIDKFLIVRDFLEEYNALSAKISSEKEERREYAGLFSRNRDPEKATQLRESIMQAERQQALCIKDCAKLMEQKFQIPLETITRNLKRIASKGHFDHAFLDFLIKESIRNSVAEDSGIIKSQSTSSNIVQKAETASHNDAQNVKEEGREDLTSQIESKGAECTDSVELPEQPKHTEPSQSEENEEEKAQEPTPGKKSDNKYKVFLSCKSEDYPLGRKVYDFLLENNVSVFMADQELRKRGISDYGAVIDQALSESDHMILIASKKEYLYKETSPYVYYEWHSFSEEIKSGRKSDNIITVLTPDVKIEDLPYALRHCQSFRYDQFEKVLDYMNK